MILVIGGKGKTGRRVAERLGQAGVEHRIGSRSSEIPFDWNDRTTWEPALEGVDAAYVTYYPDLAFPGALEAVSACAEVARAQGVRHLVLLSGRGEELAEAAEDAVRASGLDWTILRCNWFSQNFSESFFLDSVLEGVIAIPAGEAVEPFVDADDIADVAVAALTQPGHVGQLYELSGPRLLGFAEVAREISAATGREVHYEPVTADDYRTMLEKEGLPADFVDLFTMILDGRNASLTDGVQRALGRAPKDFSEFARECAAAGVWEPGQERVAAPV